MAHHANFDVINDSISSAPINRALLKLFILMFCNAGPTFAMSVGAEKIKFEVRYWLF
jgi:hypothetical protein